MNQTETFTISLLLTLCSGKLSAPPLAFFLNKVNWLQGV